LLNGETPIPADFEDSKTYPPSKGKRMKKVWGEKTCPIRRIAESQAREDYI